MNSGPTNAEIDAAIPKLKQGLRQYEWIQARIASSPDFHQDAEFRRKFNGFYRLRFCSLEWRNNFYDLMGRAPTEKLDFRTVLRELKRVDGCYQASFASKFVATFDPSKPVIDSMVLKRLSLRLPGTYAPDREAKICALYERLVAIADDFLNTEGGAYLVSQFQRHYPSTSITRAKMLDLVLWQTRTKPQFGVKGGADGGAASAFSRTMHTTLGSISTNKCAAEKLGFGRDFR